jgi:putative membrane protein
MNDEEEKNYQPTNSVIEWLIRLAKGALVGIGAIVPGFSGGVLAVVFGIYEPLMRFLASPFVNFVQNFLYFLPVGIGGMIGVVAFSAVVDFAFSHYAAQFTWLFIGFIAGTFPSLFKTAGKEGRKPWHWVLLVAMAGLTFFYMSWIETIRSIELPLNIWTWLLAGMLMGFGMVVPGMSPSNFLIYLGLYQAMANGLKQLDLGVALPIMAGVIIVILVFAKLISWLFKKSYTVMYHLILGIVVGSTLAIIPGGVSGWTIAMCALLFAFGAASSFALSKLDEKHPHESLF